MTHSDRDFEQLRPGMPVHDELEVLSILRSRERERHDEYTVRLFEAVRRAAAEGRDAEWIAGHAGLPTDVVRRHLEEHGGGSTP